MTTKIPYENLVTHRLRSIHRSRLFFRLVIFGSLIVGGFFLVLYSSTNKDANNNIFDSTDYQPIKQLSERFKQFELAMRTQSKKIVFIESSKEENFCVKLRQSCAVESAALQNPTAIVIILVRSNSLEPNCETNNKLRKLPNVEIVHFAIDEVFFGTPLLDWGRQVQLGQITSPYMRSHLSDALRLAIVHKYSAIYMDLDFIALRSFDKFFDYNGFIGREDQAALNGALIGFSRAKNFTMLAMEEFKSTYQGNQWSFNGPLLMERVFKKWGCHVFVNDCRGIKVFDSDAFYPICWQKAQKLFDEDDSETASDIMNNEKTVAVHFWNYLTSEWPSFVNSINALNILAKRYCPATFNIASRKKDRNFI